MFVQLFVPIGGTVGGSIGCIDGGAIGHTCGAHIGVKSIALEQIGVTFPLMQLHTQSAITF